jgi:hypothetical protein
MKAHCVLKHSIYRKRQPENLRKSKTREKKQIAARFDVYVNETEWIALDFFTALL